MRMKSYLSFIDLAVIGCSHGELPLILADHPVRILRGCSSFNLLLGVLMHGFDHNIIHSYQSQIQYWKSYASVH